MSRHDDLTAFTCGELPQADHPALMKVCRLAAKYRLPVLIHHNISSANRRDPIYMVEMEHALNTHPGTTFIWVHVGMSRRIEVPTLTKGRPFALNLSQSELRSVMGRLRRTYRDIGDIPERMGGADRKTPGPFHDRIGQSRPLVDLSGRNDPIQSFTEKTVTENHRQTES